MRVVLDTSVVVAALRSSKGASRQVLLAVLDERLRPLVSVPLMFEYEAVLTRPEHLLAAAASVEDVGVVLDALAALCDPVRLEFLWRPALPDADDDMVLEAAVNGQAEAIVTFNVKDFQPVAHRFGIKIVGPSAVLGELER
jgi:putative PIN family toxin of toxin-antitoxin system